MAESHVISALVDKRSELAGLIQHYQQEINRLSGDLEHIDAAIKLFNPEYDLRTISAKAHRERNKYFKPGELGRLILDILRNSQKPMTSRQIACAVLYAKSLEQNTKNVERFQTRALDTLRKQVASGVVVNEVFDDVRVWRVAS